MKTIAVIGKRGLVASAFSDDKRYELIRSDNCLREINEGNYGGIVNAAAITGEPKCQSASLPDVMRVNVMTPLRMLDFAQERNIPFVMFSTAAVYKNPEITSEDDEIAPRGRYSMSKVAMEYTLRADAYEKLYIFRIPFVVMFKQHDADLSIKVKSWKYCEDVTGSVVYKPTLYEAVNNAINGVAPGGVYNIASDNVHFPSYLEDKFGWNGDIVPAHSMNRSPNCMLNCSKAKGARLISND